MRAVLVDRLVEPRELRVSETSGARALPRRPRRRRQGRGLQLLRHPDGAGPLSGEAAAPVRPGRRARRHRLRRRRRGRRVPRRRSRPRRRAARRVRRAGGRAGARRVADARRHDVRGRRRAPDRLSDVVRRRSCSARTSAPGETLLVHAAAGGVGLAAVQIGKALGARVLATAGGPDKLAIAREAGADVASTTAPTTGSSA